MRNEQSRPTALLGLVLVPALAWPAACDDPLPQGGEFHVNTIVEQNQQVPSVAMDADGDFVVVYMTRGFPAAVTEYPIRISGQRFSADGTAQGSEFRVDTLNFYPEAPVVDMDAAGNFVVAWQDFDDDGGDGAIWARRYAANGSALALPFQVNSTGSDGGGGPINPDVAVDADGDFVVVWQSFDTATSPVTYTILGQRYDETGAAQGGEFTITSSQDGQVVNPVVATDDAGNFTVAWTRNISFHNDLEARRYDADGVALGSAYAVATSASMGWSIQGHDVGIDADGDTVFAWNHAEVRARLYDATGEPVTSSFLVGPGAGNEGEMAVAMGAGGDFVVTWYLDFGNPAGRDVVAQRYVAGGGASGQRFRGNSHGGGDQRFPTAAMDAAGNFVLAWSSSNQEPDPCPPEGGPQCAPGTGIYAQRFSPPATQGDADLAISISDAPDPVYINSIVAYTVTVTNLEEANSAACVSSVFTMPSGASFASFAGPWNCGGAPDATCELFGALGPGESSSYVVRMGAPTISTTLSSFASTHTAAQSDPDPENNSDTEMTAVLDNVPDQFTFTDVGNRPTGTEFNSNLITIAGIDTPASVTVTGGRYSKNGSAFTTAPGNASNGDTFRVRLMTSDATNTATHATLTIGGVSDTYTLTTGTVDTTPDAFNFTDRVDVAAVSNVNSAPVIPTGFTSPATISVSGSPGASYAINASGYVTTPGTVTPGDQVRLRVTSLQGQNAAASVTVNIGGRTDTWFVTTGADSTPLNFNFPDKVDQPAAALSLSATRYPVGFNQSVPISITGEGDPQFSVAGGGFTSGPAMVSNNQVVRLRLMSPQSQGATHTATVTIGGVSDTFAVTTGADSTPAHVAFPDLTGKPKSFVQVSAVRTMTGFNQPLAVSISGTPSAQFSINGGEFGTVGTINTGDTLQLRMTTSANGNTAQTATVSFGTINDTWSVTTKP